MSGMSEEAHEILDVAERLVRSDGYNGFSIAQVADEAGLSSERVRNHFSGKTDLGRAMARRYTERFLEALGDPIATGRSAADVIGAYAACYRAALENDGLMCLCGILGAELDTLPPPVAGEARYFFERNADWLTDALEGTEVEDAPAARRRAVALSVIAALEGAMIVARSLDDISAFDEVAQGLPRLATAA